MDKRVEHRFPNNIRFFIHIHECKEDPDMVGVSVACEAVDFSHRGIQFKTDTRLIQHTLLNITIGIGEPFAMFLLRGEVRWIKDVDDHLTMGVLLQDEEGTDYDKWEAEFDSIFGGQG